MSRAQWDLSPGRRTDSRPVLRNDSSFRRRSLLGCSPLKEDSNAASFYHCRGHRELSPSRPGVPSGSRDDMGTGKTEKLNTALAYERMAERAKRHLGLAE